MLLILIPSLTSNLGSFSKYLIRSFSLFCLRKEYIIYETVDSFKFLLISSCSILRSALAVFSFVSSDPAICCFNFSIS
jgi:hypothetical protein